MQPPMPPHVVGGLASEAALVHALNQAQAEVAAAAARRRAREVAEEEELAASRARRRAREKLEEEANVAEVARIAALLRNSRRPQ